MYVPQDSLSAVDLLFNAWFAACAMRSLNRFDNPLLQHAARPPYTQLLKASAFSEFPGRSKMVSFIALL
jgi:hypothetical protein